jgi:hypothetical protein
MSKWVGTRQDGTVTWTEWFLSVTACSHSTTHNGYGYRHVSRWRVKYSDSKTLIETSYDGNPLIAPNPSCSNINWTLHGSEGTSYLSYLGTISFTIVIIHTQTWNDFLTNFFNAVLWVTSRNCAQTHVTSQFYYSWFEMADDFTWLFIFIAKCTSFLILSLRIAHLKQMFPDLPLHVYME